MYLGKDPQEADGTEKPIEWVVLEKNEKGMLLLSRYGLDAKAYNEKLENVTWEDCTLRKWLNEEFYNKAFNEEEKKKILKIKLPVPTNPEYPEINAGNATEDKVFLLSIKEINHYLKEKGLRCRKPTKYAKARGAWTYSGNGNGYWWLRSPGGDCDFTAGISFAGSLYYNGYFVSNSDACICPAVFISNR